MKIKKFEANKPFWTEEPVIMKRLFLLLKELFDNDLQINNFDYSEFTAVYRVTFTLQRDLDESSYEKYSEFLNIIKKNKGWSLTPGPTARFVVTLIINKEHDVILEELELIYNTNRYNL